MILKTEQKMKLKIRNLLIFQKNKNTYGSSLNTYRVTVERRVGQRRMYRGTDGGHTRRARRTNVARRTSMTRIFKSVITRRSVIRGH